MKARTHTLLVSVLALATGTQAAIAKPALDHLAEGFAAPSVSARPLVYWFWLDGNISEQGIDLDLDWMHRAGLGGFDLFNVSLLTPSLINPRLPYMSPEWRKAFRFTMRKADALGLEANIESTAGWSLSGATWVEPHQAMKKYVWSETPAIGGRRFMGKLGMPSTVAGPFQSAPRRIGPTGIPVTKPAPFYRDDSVFAFHVPADARGTIMAEAALTTNGGKAAVTPADLSNPIGATTLDLPAPTTDRPSWVRYDFDRPQTVRSLVVATDLAGYFEPQVRAILESSEDGVAFRTVKEVPIAISPGITLSFPAATARHFRISFLASADDGPIGSLIGAARQRNTALPAIDWIPQLSGEAVASPPLKIRRLALFGDTQLDRFELKTGFSMADDYYAIASAPVGPGSVVRSADVVNLTGKMRADGTLDWTPPPGTWSIVRLGYGLTGRENIPAETAATGLEVDKLNATHVEAYINRFLDLNAAAAGADLFGQKGLTGLLTDSVETGPQNWTEDMLGAFQRLRGYDPRPFLPALTGRVVDSSGATEQFLWDFRRTIAELLATNHYGTIAKVARARGLRVLSEALENGRPLLGDDMEMRRYADVPMGAFWTSPSETAVAPAYIADLKGAASVAHIYGREIVGAESMTSELQPWTGSPRTLKSAVDAIFALGANRLTIHSSVHQPLVDKAPGLALAIYGQYFNRNETWAEQARPWVDYIARTSYILQQGRYHADVAFFYGEEAPLTALYSARANDAAPTRNGYDYVNADIVLNKLRVSNGALVTESGMRYSVLQLGGSADRMTLTVLRRLAALVDQGAVVFGEKPSASPSLADDPVEFRRLADSLWARSPVTGTGGVIAEGSIDAAMASRGIGADWEIVSGDKPALMFLHRDLPDGDTYFVSNRSGALARSDIAFAVAGRAPELWDAETGKSAPLPYRVENGRTIVSLDLDANGAALVIFRRPANTSPSPVASQATVAMPLADLNQDWSVRFQPGRGVPEGARVATTGSWSDNVDPAVRHFSGTASYTRNIDIPASVLWRDRRVLLDLGTVREIAEVIVNGKPIRTLWKPPYRLDLTGALKPGRNRIELRVTNLWINRLIGDAQPGAKQVALLGGPAYLASAPLAASGLIGPVALVGERPIDRR